MEIDAFTTQLNDWGKAHIPFIFVVDFEMCKPKAWRLDEVDAENILFDFNGFTNQRVVDIERKIVRIEAYPGTFESYQRQFQVVMQHLERGNSFLTNLTLSTPVTLTHHLTDLFHLARARYKLLIKDELLVFSPETFVQIRDGWIRTFPMKGTIAADTPNAAETILADVKEMSEHITVVDLLRNDLSMVATSVNVKRFRYIEKIRTSDGALLQVSSEIEGKVMDEYNHRLGDLLTCILPAGSICGAPKPATLRVIREAEHADRGYYTGVCGYFDGKVFDSGVMIRYIEKRDGGFFFRSGGGITTQSMAAKEYQETLDKIMSRFIETIRIANGKAARLEYHQGRVHATSTNFYGKKAGWDIAGLLSEEAVPANGVFKCRITYEREPVRVEFEPYTIQDIRSLKIVHGDDIHYEYKFADRSDLNRLFALREGRDDILIVQNGRVADTSYGNIVLSDPKGTWYTPATCILRGTMRQYLVDNGVIIERVIPMADLKQYSAFKVINALREWDTTPAEVLNID